MGSFSIWHWLVVLAIVLLLFGTGRVSNLMGDLAKGVKAFKKGLQEEDAETSPGSSPSSPSVQPKALAADPAKPAEAHRDEAARH